MSNINVTVRMDSELKTRADEVFAQMGMNLSTAVNIFLRQTLREGQLPFTPSLVPNAETVAALEESEQRSLPRYDVCVKKTQNSDVRTRF
nr:type II toxin-antitoxin system RelB/DinJ family antitoxin [Mobiluncus mulieris]